MARALVCLLAVTLFVFAAGSLSFDTKQRPGAGPAPSSSQRIVTLAPALTETLFAIGAGDRVVGVSDHCRYPAAIAGRQRAGSWLSPNYEALARLEPSLIVTSAEVSGPLAPLLRIAPTERLAWFSLDDMLKSILRLGALSGRASEARALVHALESKLTRPAPPTAPRVLLTLEHQPGRLSEVWFLRDDSIHGAVLRAAGGRNAVPEPSSGPPRLSLQRLFEVDPDIVIVLSRTPDVGGETARRYIEDFRALGALGAAKSRRIGVIQGEDVHVTGPRIVRLVDRLASEIARLEELP